MVVHTCDPSTWEAAAGKDSGAGLDLLQRKPYPPPPPPHKCVQQSGVGIQLCGISLPKYIQDNGSNTQHHRMGVCGERQ